MHARTRWTVRVGVAVLAVGLAAPAAWAATSWSPSPTADKTVGPATEQYSWSYGNAASRTKAGKVAVSYASDGGSNIANSKQSIYVRTGTVDTSKAITWGTPKLVSPKTQISDRATIATGRSNNNLYVTWASQTGYGAKYDPNGARATWFRAYVAGTGWAAPVRLSSATGHVDYPVVAGSGNNVYVAYTDSDSGDVLLRTSSNAGANWGSTTLGTTTRPDPGLGYGPEGLGSWPVSCAAGTNLGVVWLDGTGDIKLSVSKTSGTGISTTTINTSGTAGGDDGGWAQCDAVGSRIGVTWNQDDGVYYAEYNTGSNSFTTAAHKIYSLPDGTHNASYGGAVALNGTSTVGISAPLCVQDLCDYSSNSTRIDLAWFESTNNGSSFPAPTVIADSSVTGKPLNDSPSPLFYDANTRFVIYNGWNAPYTNYRLYTATGKS